MRGSVRTSAQLPPSYRYVKHHDGSKDPKRSFCYPALARAFTLSKLTVPYTHTSSRHPQTERTASQALKTDLPKSVKRVAASAAISSTALVYRRSRICVGLVNAHVWWLAGVTSDRFCLAWTTSSFSRVDLSGLSRYLSRPRRL